MVLVSIVDLAAASSLALSLSERIQLVHFYRLCVAVDDNEEAGGLSILDLVLLSQNYNHAKEEGHFGVDDDRCFLAQDALKLTNHNLNNLKNVGRCNS